jgi:hypothetical protein
MSEFEPQGAPLPDEQPPTERSNAVWIAAIIAITVVSLACIIACTITAYAFLVNAPW